MKRALTSEQVASRASRCATADRFLVLLSRKNTFRRLQRATRRGMEFVHFQVNLKSGVVSLHSPWVSKSVRTSSGVMTLLEDHGGWTVGLVDHLLHYVKYGDSIWDYWAEDSQAAVLQNAWISALAEHHPAQKESDV